MKVLVYLCVTNVFDNMGCCGNSFRSHSARFQANNDLKITEQAKSESENCQNTIETRDELKVLKIVKA